MRILVIGATGYVGTHVVRALAAANHAVSAVTRDRSRAAALERLGAAPVMARDLHDPEVRGAALAADCTIYCARVIDADGGRTAERRVVEAVLDVLAGRDKAFVFTSGTGVLGQMTGGDWLDDCFAEDDPFVPAAAFRERVATEELVRAAAGRGVRGIVVRPPSIWGGGLSSHALHVYRSVRERGAACYVGAGLNCYTNVHVEDLSELYRLVAERGVAGAVYHATGGEVPNRWLAEAVARGAGVATASITLAEAASLWGEFNARYVMAASSRTSSPRSRAELGWTHTHFDMLAETETLVRGLHRDDAETQRALGRRPSGLVFSGPATLEERVGSFENG